MLQRGMTIKDIRYCGVWGIYIETDQGTTYRLTSDRETSVINTHVVDIKDGKCVVANKTALINNLKGFLSVLDIEYTILDNEDITISAEITTKDGNGGTIEYDSIGIYEFVPKVAFSFDRIEVDHTTFGIISNLTAYDYVNSFLNDYSVTTLFKGTPKIIVGLKQLLLAYIRNRTYYLGNDIKDIVLRFEERLDEMIMKRSIGITIPETICKAGIISVSKSINFEDAYKDIDFKWIT